METILDWAQQAGMKTGTVSLLVLGKLENINKEYTFNVNQCCGCFSDW